jgi:hypothetical protein
MAETKRYSAAAFSRAAEGTRLARHRRYKVQARSAPQHAQGHLKRIGA